MESSYAQIRGAFLREKNLPQGERGVAGAAAEGRAL